MSATRFAQLNALGGLLGVVMLVVSFSINPGPPDNPSPSQLIAFGNAYHTQILAGAWLQAAGAALTIVFALAIVHLAGATTRFGGWLTLFGGLLLVVTSLVEVTFFLSAVNATQVTAALTSLDLIHAAQHLYFMVAAPAVFLPLGAVIRDSRVLPRIFGYLAYLLGGVFAVVGIAGLYVPLQTVGNILGVLQGFWWLGIAVALLIRPEPTPPRAQLLRPRHVTA
jgi:hypothetical protein